MRKTGHLRVSLDLKNEKDWPLKVSLDENERNWPLEVSPNENEENWPLKVSPDLKNEKDWLFESKPRFEK